MEIEVISESKSEATVNLDSVTIAEVIRVYLGENGADFAAWRREHPSKPVLLKISSAKGVSKAVSDSVAAIKKDCDKLAALAKK